MSQDGEHGNWGYDVKVGDVEANGGATLTAGALSFTAGVAVCALSAEVQGQLAKKIKKAANTIRKIAKAAYDVEMDNYRLAMEREKQN